ncbi:hypothetical protein [Halalkalibacter urbisdiaboli]|uniref:hypothetical protein n=1 Tax=Halalkalibacter urbisdiaboli TaxID=1960589 RepID=UPI000B4347FE|nr:hypothetical protein [Halalkalibacter urbisdiaboli]
MRDRDIERELKSLPEQKLKRQVYNRIHMSLLQKANEEEERKTSGMSMKLIMSGITGSMVLLLFILLLSVNVLDEHRGTNQGEENEITVIGERSQAEVPLMNQSGKVAVTFDEKQVVDIHVTVNHLNPKELYTVSFVRDNEGGVTFGPKENVEIFAGEIIGETSFRPSLNGKLSISMEHPSRVFAGANAIEIRIEPSGNQEEILKSEAFKINIKE